MKKIIVNILIIICSIFMAYFINKGCFYIIDKFDFISDNLRLGVLCIPFIIYGTILFVIVPHIIIFIGNKMMTKKQIRKKE